MLNIDWQDLDSPKRQTTGLWKGHFMRPLPSLSLTPSPPEAILEQELTS